MALQQLGPYELLEVIGRGGMGTVYRARDTKTDDIVAVKALAPVYSFDEHFRARFESEIDTLIGLDHPHIVRIISYGQEDGNLFFAMELVTGSSLFQKLKSGFNFHWRDVFSIAKQVSAGLRHAHERGVIHRDLKPGNLLIDPEQHVKITDFGIAKTFGGQQMTGDGNIVGTMDFMAPEQASGKPATAKSDLYSLGIVMYTLFSGKPPLAASSIEQTFENLKRREPPRLDSVVTNVPEPVADLIHQLLQKDPDERVPTALALMKRIDALVEELRTDSEAKTHVVAEPDSDDMHVGPGVPTDMTVVSAKPKPSQDDRDMKTRLTPVKEIAAKNKQAESKTRATKITPQKGRQQSPYEKKLLKSKREGKKNTPESNPSVQSLAASPDATVISGSQSEKENSSVVKQPDYFNPVTDRIRDRSSLNDDFERRRGKIWPVALMLVATLAVLIVGVYFAVIKRPSADYLLAEIDSDVDRLPRVRDEIDNFIDWYPDHERFDEVLTLQQIAAANVYTKKLEDANATRLSDLEREYISIVRETRTDREKAISLLNAFLVLHSQNGDENNECLTHVRGFVLRLEIERNKYHEQKVSAVQDALRNADKFIEKRPQEAIKILESAIMFHSDYEGVQDLLEQAQNTVDELNAKLDLTKEPDN